MKDKIIQIGKYTIDQNTWAIVAGPCSIESEEQFLRIVKFLKTQNISSIRGGIFKLRTQAQNFQGLREKAYSIVKNVKKQENFNFITEIVDPRQLDALMDITDVFQVGTRNMYNYELLKELGKIDRPVLLKRNFSAPIKEWIFALDYITQGGNQKIILCERGIRTFETAYRNTFDINAISYLKDKTPYLIFADPSHGTGDSAMVSDIAKASLVAGANGLLIEVHDEPSKALSDGAQALDFKKFTNLINDIQQLAKLLNKKIV